MARSSILLCVIVYICICFTESKRRSVSPNKAKLELGLRKVQKAIEVALWYEHVKNVYPFRNESIFNQYDTLAETDVNYALSYRSGVEKQMSWFPKWFATRARRGLDEEYSKCFDLLEKKVDTPTVDEGEALNDAATGKNYSLKGCSHCVIHTLRERHGDKAVEAVKNERSVTLKEWRESIFDRENEHRRMHGVEPLRLDRELNRRAKTWARQMAKDCYMHHSPTTDDVRQYKGAVTGENLGYGGSPEFVVKPQPILGSNMDSAVVAMKSANEWYDEIRFYPFPEGYQKNISQDMENFRKFSHFTQSVWKDTKFVGYGIAWNSSCTDGQLFLAAHYFPAGNQNFKFVENVLPPKNETK